MRPNYREKDDMLLNAIGILLVHFAALCVVIALWRHAPDPVQKGFLFVAGAAEVTYLFADFLTLYGIDNRRGGLDVLGIDALWQVTSVAGAIAHGALLIYLVRQWWLKTQACKLLKELRHDAG